MDESLEASIALSDASPLKDRPTAPEAVRCHDRQLSPASMSRSRPSSGSKISNSRMSRKHIFGASPWRLCPVTPTPLLCTKSTHGWGLRVNASPSPSRSPPCRSSLRCRWICGRTSPAAASAVINHRSCTTLLRHLFSRSCIGLSQRLAGSVNKTHGQVMSGRMRRSCACRATTTSTRTASCPGCRHRAGAEGRAFVFPSACRAVYRVLSARLCAAASQRLCSCLCPWYPKSLNRVPMQLPSVSA